MGIICTLLATCKAHDVNLRLYLNNVISDMSYKAKASEVSCWRCCHTNGNSNTRRPSSPKKNNNRYNTIMSAATSIM